MAQVQVYLRKKEEEGKTQLSFEDICPKWSARLKKPLTPYQKDVIQGNMKLCVVGEAHGFSNEYSNGTKGCQTCDDFSGEFSLYVGNTIDDNKALIAEFVQHWNEVHVK